MTDGPILLGRLREMIDLMRQHQIPTIDVDGEPHYGVRLHASRLQEAFDAGLAPFCLIDGSPWIESMLPVKGD